MDTMNKERLMEMLMNYQDRIRELLPHYQAHEGSMMLFIGRCDDLIQEIADCEKPKKLRHKANEVAFLCGMITLLIETAKQLEKGKVAA